MELVELYAKRGSLESLVNPPERQSRRLAEEQRREIERAGGRAPRRAKRRASAATKIGTYSPPEPETVFKVETPQGPVFALATFHPEKDGQGRNSGEPFVACGCVNGDIRILSLMTSAIIKEFKAHSDAVTCLKLYQPKTSPLVVLVSGSSDNTVRITLAESGKTNGVLRGHSKDVWCVDIIEQTDMEPLVVSGSLDGTVCVWSMLEHTLLKRLSSTAGPVYCLAVVSESHQLEGCPLIFAGYGDRRVRMWSLESGEVVQEFRGHSKRITCMSVLAPSAEMETARLAAAGKNTDAENDDFLDISSTTAARPAHKVAKEIKATKQKARDQFRAKCCCLYHGYVLYRRCFHCLTCSKNEEQERTELMERVKKISDSLEDDSNVLSREVFLVTGCEDGKARVFHAETGLVVRTVESDGCSPINAMSLTIQDVEGTERLDQEPMLVVGGRNGKVRMWHLDTGRLLRTLQPHSTPILSLSMTTNISDKRVSRRNWNLSSSAAGGQTSSTNPAESFSIIVTAAADGSVCILYTKNFFHEAERAYDLDQQERLPRSIMQQIPAAFASWPRTYLLAKQFGSLDEFFSREPFQLFSYAMQDDRLDFISVFLPHASSGLLVSSRRVALQNKSMEVRLRVQRYKQAVNSAVNKAQNTWSVAYIVLQSLLMALCSILYRLVWQKVNELTSSPLARDSQTLLYQACSDERKNVHVVRIVLNTWSKLLLAPPKDLLDQSAGPASCLSKHDLLRVAHVFPSEFENFICNLRLVQSHEAVSDACTWNLAKGKVHKERGSNGRFLNDVRLWMAKDAGEGAASQEPYTCLFLPLRNPVDVDMVRAYITTCTRLRSVRIFKSDVGVTVNNYSWGSFGMWLHRNAFLCYCLDCVVFIVFITTTTASTAKLDAKSSPSVSGGTRSSSASDPYLAGINFLHSAASYLLGLYTLGRVKTEVQEVFYSPPTDGANELSGFVSSWTPWRVYDAVWLVARFALMADKRPDRIHMAICSLMQWGRMLYYFRAFESTGLLVAMILQIVSEIGFYLCVIFIIAFFFTQSLWVMNSVDLSRPFEGKGHDDVVTFVQQGNIFGFQSSALLATFTFMFGSYQPAFFGDLSTYLRRWSVFVSVLFMLTVCILMFNLLIAFMSDIFVRMSQHGRAQWRLMQAKTVYECGYRTASTYNKVEDYQTISPSVVHVLRRTSDMTLDSLKGVLEEGQGQDSTSVAQTIVRHSALVTAGLEAKALANEKAMLARIEAHQAALDEMLALVKNVTNNPTQRALDPSLSTSTSTPDRKSGRL